jgi:hypothetical protein
MDLVAPNERREHVGKDLTVGSAGLVGFEGSVATHLAGLGVKHDLQTWSTAKHDIATICCLNIASVVVFLRHVVRCGGHSNETLGFRAGERGETKYRNMPWWDNSVWLPTELANPGNLKDDPTTFVGSCVGLLRELKALQEESDLRLGTVPSGYEDMRADIEHFYRSNIALRLTNEDCIRWIWLALRDGADLAIKENSVLWSGPG